MTATISIKETSDDKRFYRVTCDLKGYRISQLNRMQEPNSRLVVEYLKLQRWVCFPTFRQNRRPFINQKRNVAMLLCTEKNGSVKGHPNLDMVNAGATLHITIL